MICPKCSKVIDDAASFCGYCGQVIDKTPTQEPPTQEPVVLEPQTTEKPPADEPVIFASQTNPEPAENSADEPKNDPPAKKQAKNIGMKLLLIFSIVAIALGLILGLLTAKGIINLSSVIHRNSFEWTDFSEALDTDNVSSTTDEEVKDKETNSETTSSTAEQANSSDVSSENKTPEAFPEV